MNFWKKAGGVLLALALLIGLLPLSAAAAAVCEDGKHTPDLTTLYPANWNSVTGGYGYDYYKCKDCGSACHKNGKSAVLVGPDNGCSGGEKCHLPGAAQYPADFDVCNGGYQEPYYRCTHCNRAVDAQGTIIKRYEGAHTPGADLLNPDYIACVGGYQNSYYVCTVCGTPCNADGSTAEWIGPTEKHMPDSELRSAYYTPCTGGYKEDHYSCTTCGQPCDANGVSVKWYDPTAKHTPGGEKHDADYTACVGGYRNSYYECTVCGALCNADGSTAEWIEPTAKHTPGGARHDADYTACGGGFRKDWYECTVCGQPVDENGNDVEFAEPTAKHTHGSEWNDANYTSCTGGYTMSWYECTVCGQACDENGDSVTWLAPSGSGHHIPGSEKHDADPACAGGFLEDWYECTGCGQPVDENGNLIKRSDPTAAHTPGGKKHPADYTPCGGGCKSDYYICDVCHMYCNADGSTYDGWWAPEPDAAHIPGELQAADYTVCGGGYKTTYYLCEVCGQAIDPALEWFAMWYEPTDPHTLTKMDALAPTYEADGNVEYWHCTVCGENFYDAQGEKPVEDMDDLLLPKLESRLQTSIKPGLSAVPASVAAQYPTVSDVKQALVSAALTANTTLIGTEANSVLMDVSLQRQNPDGTLTPVSAEDFPAEGVEVLLPYPEGTDRTYTFVVTHMITAGAHAGEIEVLANTPEAGGIRVRFTSMSPVCITYQKPAAKPGTDDGKQPGADDAQKPAADTKKPGTTGKNQTGTTTTTTAVKTGDNATLALWGALLVLSALVLTCRLPKKKEQE